MYQINIALPLTTVSFRGKDFGMQTLATSTIALNLRFSQHIDIETKCLNIFKTKFVFYN